MKRLMHGISDGKEDVKVRYDLYMEKIKVYTKIF